MTRTPKVISPCGYPHRCTLSIVEYSPPPQVETARGSMKAAGEAQKHQITNGDLRVVVVARAAATATETDAFGKKILKRQWESESLEELQLQVLGNTRCSVLMMFQALLFAGAASRNRWQGCGNLVLHCHPLLAKMMTSSAWRPSRHLRQPMELDASTACIARSITHK